jgi:hypothetical protein
MSPPPGRFEGRAAAGGLYGRRAVAVGPPMRMR